jgi:hypothetical protein
VPAGSIQRILGPENRITTELYLHSIGDSKRRAIENFPMTVGKRVILGLFRIGERSVLKNGFRMRRPAIFVPNAAIKFSGAL